MTWHALRITVIFLLLVIPAILPAIVWAEPSITSLTGTPTTFPSNVQTKVHLTVTVTDPTFNPSSVMVERQEANGTWKNFKKTDFLSTANPLVFTQKVGFNESTTGAIRIRLAATFTSSGKNKYSSPVLQLSVGRPTTPSTQDTTIQGAGGTSVTIKGGALQGLALVGIAPAPAGTIPISSTEKPLVTTVDIVVVPGSESDQILLTEPLKVSVPAPTGTPDGARFYFVVPVLAPSSTGLGLEKKLLFVDTGTSVNGQIVTQSNFYPGIFTSGPVAVVKETGSLNIQGIVRDTQANPRPGTWVEEVTGTSCAPNTLCSYGWYADSQGNFRVSVTGTLAQGGQKTDWTIRAIDGFRCNQSGNLSGRGDSNTTIPQDITVSPVANFAPRLTGLRNGGFEAGLPTNCWPSLTAGQMIQRGTENYLDLFGFNTTIEPSEEDWMAALTQTNTTIEQRFTLPAFFSGSEKKLRFDFHFGCKASCPLAKQSAIAFEAEVLTDAGAALNPRKFVGKTFKQFDGQLGWRTAEIDLSNLYDAGGVPTVNTPLRLRFTLTSQDAGATVLVDNIRFDTVFVNVTILAGVTTTENQVRTQVRNANELLSQGGTNVRIRNLTTNVSQTDGTCNSSSLELVTPPGTDITWNPPTRTAEGIAATCIGAKTAAALGAPNSDVEVTYVNTLCDGGNCLVFGAAVTVEEFQGLNPPTPLNFDFMANYDGTNANTLKNETGILMASFTDPNRVRETLAHEIGHLLLNRSVDSFPAPSAGSTFEHASDQASVMTSPGKCISICSGRVSLDVEQLRRWALPGTPPAPRCPVTCPH